ncbi:MAG: hypothetical protein EON59_11900 [Alphaproteobacteria bacterium]|nr:MAG: hypothetical protein EON59_11900 [Alphaproteobacteria bacterium]
MKQLSMLEARESVSRARAHRRPEVLTDLRERLASHLWLRLAGEYWSRCEGDRRALSDAMRTFEDWSGLMTSQRERTLHGSLPDEVVVWRGCHLGLNEDGLSYSLDADGAGHYPMRGRYRQDEAEVVMVRAVVERDQCVVKLDCGVLEVLVRQALSRETVSHQWRPAADQYDIMNPVRPRRCLLGTCLHIPT